MRSVLEDLGSSIAASLRPAAVPFAWGAAVRTVIVAGAILVVGDIFGELDAVGIAYLGTACAVAFVQTRTYLSIASTLIGQAAGAVSGFCIAAAVPTDSFLLVASASAAAVVSGMVGSLSPAAPAFGMMLSIGLAYGQFGDTSLTWWLQCVWYLVGTAAVGAVWLWPWMFDHRADSDAASVFDAAADLCEGVGRPDADERRARLAAASTAARAGRRDARAELAGYAAAILYAEGTVTPKSGIAALRDSAERCRSGGDTPTAPDFDASTPGLVALLDALSESPSGLPGAAGGSVTERLFDAARSFRSRDVQSNGARLGVCMGVATAISIALHGASHSFWLPLTVAVIMRPEYASIFVRTVNRVSGTVVGAMCATVILLVVPAGVGVALGAACALAFAVLMAPKLYGLNVVGVTAAALLASSIGSVDDVLPLVRLLDTALGALVAVVIGYVLWPNVRRFSGAGQLHDAAEAARIYLTAAVDGSSPALQPLRDDAYRAAHLARLSTERALVEPPPINHAAQQQLPCAIRVERVIDDITLMVATADAGRSVDDLHSRIAEEIDTISRHR